MPQNLPVPLPYLLFATMGELAQKNPSYGFEGTNIVLSPPFIQVWKPKKIYVIIILRQAIFAFIIPKIQSTFTAESFF